ncbi:hypothetical protein [Lysinibacillus sp. JNUCC-52]|uniref:hypothetical protein n=1 Tax=Lysinibacillus sp. JNUCC-52 TaxID=2792480 RepID=UPI001936E783|nr:hypothetical protein JNUCC52_06630 [Lysinibacillus sp. JNUCC-52]
MDLFIASDRQLPIRYYVNEAIWIRRGCFSPPQLTLPFFVEVEIKNNDNLSIITQYIREFQCQYKSTEMQILVKDNVIYTEMEVMLNDQLLSNHTITIHPLSK